ncbi:MAG TPA: recombinase family protein, partial [bacterium]|nr:recombinase family protein [bacterium]
MKRAVIYCRISSLRQLNEGESLDQQERQCQRTAEINRLEVAKVFKETYSGRKDSRPAFDEMMAYIKDSKRGIKAVIFRDIDRLTRKGSHSFTDIKLDLEAHGIELIDSYGYIQPSINTLEHLGMAYDWSKINPSRDAEMMRANQANNEVSVMLTRTVGAEIIYARYGYWNRRPPLGYINTKIETPHGRRVVLAPHPEEGEFVIKVFEMRAAGFSDTVIADKLRALGFKRRNYCQRDSSGRIILEKQGKPLDERAIPQVVLCTVYAGIICEKWTNNQPVKAAFDGLVSIDTYNKANKGRFFIQKTDSGYKLLRDVQPVPRAIHRNAHNPLFPFKRFVHCPICHKALKGSSPKGQYGVSYPTYHCSRGHKYKGYRKDDLENLAFRTAETYHLAPEMIDLIEATVLDEWQSRKQEQVDDSAKIKKHLATLEAQKTAVADKIVLLSSPVAIQALEAKLEALEIET